MDDPEQAAARGHLVPDAVQGKDVFGYLGKCFCADDLCAGIDQAGTAGELPIVVDKKVPFADMADGKPKLLNIFASWCVPCVVEAPQLQALRARGIDVVGVAIRDHPQDLAGFLARNGNPYSRIGADDVSKIQFDIGSSGVPESFVIDGKGVIRYQHIGDIRADQVDLIAAQVAEAGQ